jgi:hypothetical protein
VSEGNVQHVGFPVIVYLCHSHSSNLISKRLSVSRRHKLFRVYTAVWLSGPPESDADNDVVVVIR